MKAREGSGAASPVRRVHRLLGLAVVVAGLPAYLGLAGCAGGSMDDLVSYVEEVRARKSTRIAPLPEIQVPEIYVYSASEQKDPFQPIVEEQPDDVIVARPNNETAPPQNHIREELEYYPLDSLRMVGTLAMQEDMWALVTAPDGAVHRVQSGNYLGKNYGKITLVATDRVELTEIVPDGMGGWQERNAKLDLSE